MSKYIQSIVIAASLLMSFSADVQATDTPVVTGQEFPFMQLPRTLQSYIVVNHIHDQTTIKALNRTNKHTQTLVNDRGVLNVNSFGITDADVIRLVTSVEPKKIQRVTLMSSALSILAFIRELSQRCHNVKTINIHNSYDFRTMRKNAETINFDDNLVRELLQNCSGLTSLHVTYGHSPLMAGWIPFSMKLTDSTLETLSNCCINLEDIDLMHSNDLSSQAVLSLVAKCNRLKRLNLNWLKSINDQTVKELVEIRPTLQLLHLQGTSVGPVGVREVANKCSNLTSLNICTSRIDNDTAMFVIRNCLELSYLKLELMPESDSVFDALVLYSHKLHTLDLTCSRGINFPAVMNLLNGRDTLRALNVDFTSITIDQIIQLHAIRPIMVSHHIHAPLPDDFDAARYLDLNPEIKNYIESNEWEPLSAARSHYLEHGMTLGCRYK